MTPQNFALCINEVDDFCKELLWSFETKDSLELDCSNIEQIDMSGVQALIATKIYADKYNKTFTIVNLSSEVLSAINIMGANKILSV